MIRVQLPARRAYSPEGGPGFGPSQKGDIGVYLCQLCLADLIYVRANHL